MAQNVRRGKISLTIPDKVNAKKDIVTADRTRTLLNIIKTFINERDSIEKMKATTGNENPAHISQLSGISNPTTEKNLTDAYNASYVNGPVYARDINHMINYTNELATTTGSRVSSYQVAECQYPQRDVTIIKINQNTVVPDMEMVDPVTGETVIGADGKPVMVPGLRNPIPLLDGDGNPVYYTKTGKQVFVEGPPVNVDETQKIIRCTNISIVCPNRVKMSGFDYVNDATPDHIVYACSNTKRNQIVFTNAPSGQPPIPNVATDEMIKADTFNLVIENLSAINTALDSYKSWFGEGQCAGTCQLACQTACQSACQLACQHCFFQTCHNQNCGGWS
jgi:hypothetical protein|nr:MAG TPA: Six-cysteine peptide SCIFF [Caudoviricetes sp.]